ncbi:3-oxoadipyl-CoA/3-oxo-5,6-dehydrosuberyl-CoA thiolase [Nocardia cerradoensis]|uniref:3-oxoadipyl-CoA/3-oxo-5,6-dehydrosuberyl-CoA thiolase n=1 Tax=Nocardia cerradoensis TaxID=85688 RepID=A0A231GXC2_9NOCA|nr:acetyl-CoA C-acetyltransferase [Nocardia cerradoensis]OXR41238.1 3-oxoadipyl-CoA/3-oxo-5,6-dehydrosuberyl-CoA thiolase [Nocardia cerradoensis]
MTEAVIVSTARSPTGRAGKGTLTGIRPDDLATQIIRAALDKIPALDPASIEDIYVGAWEHTGEQGENIARRIAVQLGLDTVPGATVNRACASSVQTTRMAANAIKAGDGDIFVSAGVECVSRYPQQNGVGAGDEAFQNPLFAAAQERTAQLAATGATWTDPRAGGALPDIYITMGQTAENVATHRGISRAEQDEFAARSQQLAEKAIADGFFDREIAPVTLPDGTVVRTDDGPRAGTTVEKLAGLRTVFRESGSVTAGNACPLNDGAAALVIMSDRKAAELGLTPLARVVATAVSGLSPEIMGLGPVEASRRALAKAGLSIGDIDLVEINEAFAAQVIPSYRDLGIDLDRLNVNGGGIALGHPFGATGARITTTLLHALQERDLRFGLETMCIGGGQGMAVIFERIS